PVEDEALNLALDDDRYLADGLVDRLGLGDGFGRRPRRADELDERDEMRWVDRMGDEAAMAAFEALREQVRHDGRGGGGENGVGRGQTVELGENRALRFDTLGQALLNEVRAVERIGKIGGEAHASRRGLGILEEPLLGEVAQPLRHQAARLLGDIGRDIMSATSKAPPANTIAQERPIKPAPTMATRFFTSTAFFSSVRGRLSMRARDRSRSPTLAPAPRCGRTGQAQDRDDGRR